MPSRMVSGLLLALAFVSASGSQPDEQTQSPSVPAIAMEFMGGSGGGLQVNATDGWEFAVKTLVTVTSLGVWDYEADGLNSEIPVGLWDADGELLAKATVPAGTAAPSTDGFRYVAIAPITLRAGENYIIGAAYTPETKENIGGGNTSARFFSDGAIRWVKRRRTIRQTELAFPKTTNTSVSGVPNPGGFGPNFLIEKPTTPRRYYRTYRLEAPNKYVMLDLAESEDGIHNRDPVIQWTLFAHKDGTLTQVLVNGKPFGVGPEALKSANANTKELAATLQKATLVRPNVRVTAPSWVRYADVTKAVDAATGPRVTLQVRRTAPARIEFSTLRDTQLPLVTPGADGRFVDRGDYVEDSWTGLLWQKDGATSGKKNFQQAAEYAAELKLGGLTDWRVPTIEELATVFPAVDAPFSGTKYTKEQCCAPPHEYASYWTSELDTKSEDYAYVYHWYASGGANNCYASRNFVYVRAVHDPLDEIADSARKTARRVSEPASKQTRGEHSAQNERQNSRAIQQDRIEGTVQSTKQRIVSFLRSNVVGRSVVGKVSTSIDRGRLESVFERRTTFARLLESPNGFGFDEVLRIRESITPRGSKNRSEASSRNADRTVILRHQYSIRASTGELVGYTREISGNSDRLSAAAVVKRGRVSFENGVLTIRTSTVGYDDHVSVKGPKPGGFRSQTQYSIIEGQLRRVQANEYFEVDPDTDVKTPDRRETELLVEDETP
ncbi:MAG: DUF1566 domain-containing protein [Planctomycetes bacterium]|nr:DUF1566 domain-containing protein [Planctomycetota bacterium]